MLVIESCQHSFKSSMDFQNSIVADFGPIFSARGWTDKDIRARYDHRKRGHAGMQETRHILETGGRSRFVLDGVVRDVTHDCTIYCNLCASIIYCQRLSSKYFYGAYYALCRTNGMPGLRVVVILLALYEWRVRRIAREWSITLDRCELR